MVSTGWLCLAAMVVAYGCANLLQSLAAQRTQPHHSMHPGLLFRLASQRIYLAGVGCQVVGFALAFLARRELPLFLVQAAVAAGLGVMAILGVIVLKWRLPRAEFALLGLLAIGITCLVLAAKPGIARPIDTFGEIVLTVVLVAIAITGVFAARLRGAAGSVALGSLAGLAFGAGAIDSRALAASHSWHSLAAGPLLYLLLAHALVGQLLLGMAMQRGSTTAAVAAMDASATAPAAIIGLALMGDQIWPGLQWLAAVGFVCTLGAVLGLTRYARPQGCRNAWQPTPAVEDAPDGTATAVVPVMSVQATAVSPPVPDRAGSATRPSALTGAAGPGAAEPSGPRVARPRRSAAL